ncbi:uncharacterized protein LOC125523627 [Triticum urartu]|uniref:Uncharacterized protein n=1 Tax=Triticum urartu TaxID=4572 RepID=A0A8R7V774_TRIUA|nr:uncharacterized protein LOC125523627 [Triticum urartu]
MGSMGSDASFPRWGVCSLHGLNIEVRAGLDKDGLPGGGSGIRIHSHFWGEGPVADAEHGFPVYTGYSEARALIGEGATADLTRLSRQAQGMVAKMFASITVGEDGDEEAPAPAQPRAVQLRLSPELALWKSTQHAIGNVLPPKGKALRQASPQVLAQLGATDWPAALTTNNALFGGCMSNMLIGATDVRTMFSNYVTDMAVNYEYGYSHVFPTLHGLVQDALADAHALGTPYGRECLEAVVVGLPYIQDKIALEVMHKARLKDRSAQMDRRAAQVIYLFDSSVLGIAADATARGFDAGAAMIDLVLSINSHDVIDVGSDLVNSEIMNSFLNVADIAASGVVSEPALRAIYDAYAATGARAFTQRWHEPSARMVDNEIAWHICNDRHMLFRRALLGWPKARKSPARPQREADFDEVFDADFHTTGFSRPLDPEYACDGEETCNHVRRFLRQRQDEDQQLLGAL